MIYKKNYRLLFLLTLFLFKVGLFFVVFFYFFTHVRLTQSLSSENWKYVFAYENDEDEEDEDEEERNEEKKSSSNTDKSTSSRLKKPDISTTVKTTVVIKSDADGDGLFDNEDPHPDINENIIVLDDNRNGIVDSYEE